MLGWSRSLFPAPVRLALASGAAPSPNPGPLGRRSRVGWLAAKTSRRAAALALALAALTHAGAAAAHGRFPQAGQVVVDPSDPDRIFVRTTYGATLTTDGAATWYWVCPESLGFNADKEDPPVVIMADGSLVAGTFGGLSISHDFACDFSTVDGDLANRFYVDVQTTEDRQGAVAISSNGLGSFSFDVNLWETTDGAGTWTKLGGPPPADFLALSLGVSWSDPSRLYLTGRDGTTEDDLAGVLYRSDDRGDTWQRLAVPNADPATPDVQILPYIGAVAPDDPDRVYVGVVTTQGDNVVTHFELLASSDGAASWTSVFEADSAVSGFALSPDGSQIAIGGPKEGLWIAPTSTLAFTLVNELRVGCLTWAQTGLYACADQFVDGYNLGVSVDDGKTFSPISELGSPCGPPPACGADTSTSLECTSRWPTEQLELNAKSCDGAGGQGGGGAGAGAGDTSSSSCGCHVPGRDEAEGDRSAAWWALCVALGVAAARRRRR